MKWLVLSFGLFMLGGILAGYALATPGDQVWQSGIGGWCLGTGFMGAYAAGRLW